jgi:hypothetical protein
MEGSQIMLSSAGMKDLDSLARGEDKRKRDSNEKNEIHRKSVGTFSVVCSQRHRRQYEQGCAAGLRDRCCRWQAAPDGKYRVEWAGSGPSVELSISDGRETVAKVPAQILPLKKAEAKSGYSTTADQAGNKTLTEIFFGGKKYDLSIGEASAATPSDQTRGSN